MCVPIVFVAVQLMVCQDVGVESGASEEVACYFCLVCQMVPQLEWEVDVGGTESTDEVVFEGLDGAFRGVDAMIVGFDELNCTVSGGDKFLDGSRSLVICDIEGGSESFFREGVKDVAEGSNDVITLC